MQHPSQQDGVNDPPNIQPADVTLVVPSQPPAPSQPPTPSQPPASPYYLQEDEQDSGTSSSFAMPFQPSAFMPIVQGQTAGNGWAPSPSTPSRAGNASKSPPRFLRITIGATLVVVVLGFLWVAVFAQPTRPLTTSGTAPTVAPASHPTVRVQQTPEKSIPSPTPTTATGVPTGNWVPQQLPEGWQASGLTAGDALFAERTAWTFTDREEGLDYRNIGTRAAHGGTFTAAGFILSPGGKNRFANDDVRVVNNVLFDHVEAVKLLQSAVNAVPTLVKFATQGQQKFAWVDVSFELYQEQVDPNNTQQRIGGMEMDPVTNQPRIHHMSVLLIRVLPGTQGGAAPMGGTGWLVSSYELDLPNGTLQNIISPV